MSYVLATTHPVEAEPLTLPVPPNARKRAAVPLAAAVVPLLGGIGMYAMTGSVIALMFAALGPIMMIATLWDSARGRRTDARTYRRDLARGVAHIRQRVDDLHDQERAVRWRTHPDVAAVQPGDVWRDHPGRIGTIVVGRGAVRTQLEVARGSDDAQAVELRAYAGSLTDAPIVVPLDGTVCVRATPAIAAAVVRALVVQLCATHSPEHLRLVLGDDAEPWLAILPHVAYSTAERIVSVTGHEVGTLAITWCAPDAPPPAGSRTVLDVSNDLSALLMRDSVRHEVRVEAVSVVQAESLATHLAEKFTAARFVEEVVPFGELTPPPHEPGTILAVTVGRAGAVPVAVDIVSDGPHAVVVGTTGSGKSEFLVTWALALCTSFTPEEVTLLLVDFKGGTAFEPLVSLPHVTGLVTDLNPAMAKRAIHSLQAEIRRRESVIAGVGARDVADARVPLARLIIMVDEYAAMMRQLPELEAIFTDIAARGRALGIHLIIGAQRASGAIREATLANMPLRVALRVTDATDSRAIIGTDAAAGISGGFEGKGVAFIRRSADAMAQRFRSALSTSADLARVISRHPRPAATSSWWEPLPTQLSVAALPVPERGVAVGVADDQENLRRVAVVVEAGAERGWWVLGGPRSGKSNLAAVLAERHPGSVMLSPDPEKAWDTLFSLDTTPAPLIIWDDVDIAIAQWPEPWQREATEHLERLVRGASARGRTWILTAQRASGPLGRIADLLPGRVLFAVPSRLDHIAAGGSSHDHDPARPAGRALMAGTDVQFACASRAATHTQTHDPAPPFRPGGGAVGFVTRTQSDAVRGAAAMWGYRTLNVAHLDAGTTFDTTEPVALVGDAEQWQRAYQALSAIKDHGTLLIASECAPDVRLLTSDRQVPPFAVAGRWWSYRAGAAAARVTLES